jgi:hypothetical protein
MGFKRPRTAIALGLVFVVIAAVYLTVSRDAGGATALFGLGIAMAIMAFALVVGTPDDA